MPPSNVSPDVDRIHTLLIKPGHPFDAPFDRLRGYLQSRRCERIAQKVKAPADPADEGLVGVLLDVQFRQRLVDQPDRRPEFPAGRARITQSSMNRAYASPVFSIRSSRSLR